MANSDFVLELLDDSKPLRYCDDCLSNELGIQPRQQVNQICHKLEAQGRIIRQQARCDSCQKHKVTNALIISSASFSASPARAVHESRAMYGATSSVIDDIEQVRTQVVRICREIWAKQKSEAAPHSISVVINTLKSDSLLPSHQANMMLTLCNLRNAYVYENIEMGNREMSIASNAWSIILDWWNKSNK